MYRLEFDAPWTHYTVDHYRSIEECMVDCIRRFGCMCIFKRTGARTLEAKVFGEDEIVLTLIEMEDDA